MSSDTLRRSKELCQEVAMRTANSGQPLTAKSRQRDDHEGWCMLEDMCSCLSKCLRDRSQSHGKCHSSGHQTLLPCRRASLAAVHPAIEKKMMCIQCKQHCNEESVKRDVSIPPVKFISEQQVWCLLQHLCSHFRMTHLVFPGGCCCCVGSALLPCWASCSAAS